MLFRSKEADKDEYIVPDNLAAVQTIAGASFISATCERSTMRSFGGYQNKHRLHPVHDLAILLNLPRVGLTSPESSFCVERQCGREESLATFLIRPAMAVPHGTRISALPPHPRDLGKRLLASDVLSRHAQQANDENTLNFATPQSLQP